MRLIVNDQSRRQLLIYANNVETFGKGNGEVANFYVELTKRHVLALAIFAESQKTT